MFDLDMDDVPCEPLEINGTVYVPTPWRSQGEGRDGSADTYPYRIENGGMSVTTFVELETAKEQITTDDGTDTSDYRFDT